MRSIGVLAAIAGTLVLGSACGDNAGTPPGTPPPDNTAPVANFTVPECTINTACNFASTSTDDVEVTAWRWDFNGDDSPDATTANASFMYTTAGTFDISLWVSDAEGLSQTKTGTITIDPADPVNPVNPPPTAGFTYICDAATCSFTSTSSDVAPGTIATFAWTFGDDGTADVANPAHTYTITAPSEFTVTLTVTDNEGATAVSTQTVSVVPPAPPPNTPPTAGFTYVCNAASCSFTSTSTDVAPGTIATYGWTFGDGGTADVANPSHGYAVVNSTNFTVTLTVTDDEGASDVETQTITVSPPPPGAEGCITTGTRVNCFLNITSRSTIKLKLIGISCDVDAQKVVIPPPSGDQVFPGVCWRTVGDSTRIFGGTGDTAFIYEAGTQATIRFLQGTPNPGEPAFAPPAGQLTGSFPNWTINFEDGDNAGQPGEPDFADVVLQVEALPAP